MKILFFIFRKNLIQVIIVFSPLLLLFFRDNAIVTLFLKVIPDIFWGINSNTVYEHLEGNAIYVKWLYQLILIIISIFLAFKFRKYNRENIYNDGNIYLDIPYIIFWVSAKLFNYKKITLERLPIHIQFKIVINDTFDTILYDANLEETNNEKIVVTKYATDEISSEINLLLSDTYEITLDKIPINLTTKPTIIISRHKNKSSVRTYSRDFIKTIRNVISSLDENKTTINIFPYTNARHNYEIARDNCKSGNRCNIDKYYIFQSRNKQYTFNDKKHLVT